MPSLANSEPDSVPKPASASPRPSSACSPVSLRLGFQSRREERDVLAWLGRGLRRGEPDPVHSLRREYPLVFSVDSKTQYFTLWKGPNPVAFCLLWPSAYRVEGHRLRTGMISLVYTDPSERGQGHSRRVLEAALKQAELLKLSLVLLWSELEDFYARFGFSKAGLESMLIVNPDRIDAALAELPKTLASRAPLAIEAPLPGDWRSIEVIRRQRVSQLEASADALDRLRLVPGMRARVARDESGVRAFAIHGRGKDLKEVIHEWGGDTRGALLCCRDLLGGSSDGNELFLLAPASDRGLSWTLRQAGAPRVEQAMCWMRIGSDQALAEDLTAGSGNGAKFTLECRPEGRVRIRSDHGEAVLTEQSLLVNLFGGAGISHPLASQDDLKAITRDFQTKLPLPFFVWGLESI